MEAKGKRLFHEAGRWVCVVPHRHLSQNCAVVVVVVCGDGTLDGGVYAPLRVGFPWALYSERLRNGEMGRWEMGAMGADEMMREVQTTRGIVMSSASKQ